MKKAFTLIELIFVIVIIGLLAAIALPKFMTVTENAKLKGAVEVANQVVNKAVSRYELLQDSSVRNAVDNDPDIKQYLSRLTTEVDKHFNYDYNDSEFIITYEPNKNKGHYKETNDSDVNTSGNTCIVVKRTSIDVPVTVDANVTRYEYNVTEVNYSCIATQ